MSSYPEAPLDEVDESRPRWLDTPPEFLDEEHQQGNHDHGVPSDDAADIENAAPRNSFVARGASAGLTATEGIVDEEMTAAAREARSAEVSVSTNEKHKCPYCSAAFTRHHDLKSHLLTHNQEKPCVCQTCQSHFRFLEDLQRHSKLHTGERPHVCDKCGRRFARGDALARHNKGPGGCAGRRSSLGDHDDF